MISVSPASLDSRFPPSWLLSFGAGPLRGRLQRSRLFEEVSGEFLRAHLRCGLFSTTVSHHAPMRSIEDDREGHSGGYKTSSGGGRAVQAGPLGRPAAGGGVRRGSAG